MNGPFASVSVGELPFVLLVCFSIQVVPRLIRFAVFQRTQPTELSDHLRVITRGGDLICRTVFVSHHSTDLHSVFL